MATDDVIITTDDVITATDDVIHTICIDLEGKLCCKKVVCFYNNKFSTSDLFSEITHGNIDATIITEQPKKYAVGQSFFIPKKYLIKNRFLATIPQNDRPRRSLF